MDSETLSKIPDTLTYQDGDKTVLYRDHPFVKDSPDFPTFVKSALDTHREFGNRIPINVKTDEERGKWRETHLPKLYENNLLARPPALEEYEIKRPETVPEKLWSDDNAKELRTVLHKHGISKAAVADLMAIHEKAITGVNKTLQISMDEGMAALKTEYGNDLDVKIEGAKRLSDAIFKSPQDLAFFENTGMGNHPGFLSAMIKLSALAEQDSSMLEKLGSSTTGGNKGGGSMTPDELRLEIAKISSDKDHPMHQAYLRNEKPAQDYIDGLYAKAYPDMIGKKVEIG